MMKPDCDEAGLEYCYNLFSFLLSIFYILCVLTLINPAGSVHSVDSVDCVDSTL